MPIPQPRAQAPPLEFETVDGDRWRLSDQAPQAFTMIVFYRGVHCPVCQAYLRELSAKAGEFRSRGVEPIAVSGDTGERAERAKREWTLDAVTIGRGLPIDTMRAWGLFVSAGITEDEPSHFGEPGLFLIRPDGSVFYAAINSMAFGRPTLDDMLAAVDFVAENDYPARGEA